MLLAALFWKKVTVLIDNRTVVVGFGLFAALSTSLLGFSPLLYGAIWFAVFAICTGLGTSFLCLKVGRVYGSVSLGDSLTAGGVSLLLAALLYFVGVGIPVQGRIFYIALLPLVSALLLTLATNDQLEGFEVAEGSAATQTQGALASARSFERRLLVRLTVASAFIALTAGIGKGLSSQVDAPAIFALAGAETVSAIGVIAVLIIIAINKQSIRKGVYQVYSGLMVLGVAMLLASVFGFQLSFLSIGKETLWLVLSCFMAYIAFRFDLSPIWVFGIGQASYFLSSTAGWGIGSAISSYYYIEPVHTVIGVAMAFAVMLVMVYVFNGKDLSRITSLSVKSRVAETGEVQEAHGKQLNDAIANRYGLSEREIEVMEMFAQGRSASWIADTLIVSNSTVRSHIRGIYTKLDIHSRQELMDLISDFAAH